MKPRRTAVLLVLLSLAQALSATVFLRINGFGFINSLLFFAAGIASSFLLVKLPPLSPMPLPRIWGSPSTFPTKLLVAAVLLVVLCVGSQSILRGSPLSVEQADMLPVIDVMGRRFLTGRWQDVYQPIPEIWNGMQPIYLPALWMSFLPAVLFHFDLRWITVAGISASVLLCLLPLSFEKKHRLFSALLTIGVFLVVFWLLYDETNNVIRLTEEGVVFFYYGLLVYALASGKAPLLGVASALCLLSRPALAGWVPCLALVWLVRREYVGLAKAFVAGAFVVLLLVIVPFGWKPLQLFLSLPEKYIAHAQAVWETYPDHFYKSLGMAKFFGKDHTVLLHRCLVIGSFLMPVLFTGTFLLKKRGVPANNLLPASFVLTLTVFYNFLDVSYLYLYYTPVFVSLLVAGFGLAAQAGSEEKRMISSK